MTASEASFQPAQRSNSRFLAALEKRCLVWMAHRLPAWVNSDHLTALGSISLAVAGVLYWRASSHRAALAAAILFLILNWFGDSLDGTLARVRNARGRATASTWIMYWMRLAAFSLCPAWLFPDI